MGAKTKPLAPTARVGQHDFVVELPPTSSLRCDLQGRWQAARFDGLLYRRVLDGQIVIYRGPRAAPEDVATAEPIHRRVVQLALDLHHRLTNLAEPIALSGPAASRRELSERLSRCMEWTPERLAAESSRYAAAYLEPVEILPPDRYRDLVVQPATGCPNAQCTFCAFYRNRPFRVLEEPELRRHLQQVSSLFGPGLLLRTGIFVGSASGLSLAQSRLLRTLELVQEVIGTRPRGVAAFWDPDHSPQRTTKQWQALADRGLSAAYLGLETGLASLRQAVGKSADVSRLVARVAAARSARDPRTRRALRIGVVVMVGLGGPEQASAHLEATAKAVHELALDRKDVVYISPLQGSMAPQALQQETTRLMSTLREHTTAHVVSYAMEQFRYFA